MRNVDLGPSDMNYPLKPELSPALNVLDMLVLIFGGSPPTRAVDYLNAARLAWARERTGDATLQFPGLYTVSLLELEVDGTVVPLTGGRAATQDGSNASVSVITAVGIAVGCVAALVLIGVFVMVKVQGGGVLGLGRRDKTKEAEDAKKRQKALDIKPAHGSPSPFPLTAASSAVSRPAAPLRTHHDGPEKDPNGQHVTSARSPRGNQAPPSPTGAGSGSYSGAKILTPRGGYSRGIMSASPAGQGAGGAKVAPLPLPGYASPSKVNRFASEEGAAAAGGSRTSFERNGSRSSGLQANK